MIAPELEELASSALAIETAAAKGRQNLREERTRRAARRRQEEMTKPDEKGVRVLLADSVQQVERLVSRELLPLPFPFPENALGESERTRGLSRAEVAWANAGVRSTNEIFGKTAVSEAGGRPSATQLSSLSRICDACRGISAAECKSEMGDGSALLSGSDLEALRDCCRVLLRSPSEFHEVIARKRRGAPHTDPELERKPECYARLVLDMSLRGLVSFGAPSEATVGVCVVPKKLGKQKLIF